jgi:hypothetical protein
VRTTGTDVLLRAPQVSADATFDGTYQERVPVA